MSKNPLFCTGEENEKLVRNSHADPHRHQKLTTSRGSPHACQVLSTSVSSSSVILFTERQSERSQCHYLRIVGGGNNHICTGSLRCAKWCSHICRAMLCISAAIAVMRCPSVTFVDHVKTNKRIFEFFSPSVSHIILVFRYQTGWRYSDGNSPNGGVDCRWGIGRNRDSGLIAGYRRLLDVGSAKNIYRVLVLVVDEKSLVVSLFLVFFRGIYKVVFCKTCFQTHITCEILLTLQFTSVIIICGKYRKFPFHCVLDSLPFRYTFVKLSTLI